MTTRAVTTAEELRDRIQALAAQRLDGDFAAARAAVARLVADAEAHGGTLAIDALDEASYFDVVAAPLGRALVLAEALGDRERIVHLRSRLAEEQIQAGALKGASEALAGIPEVEDHPYACIVLAELAMAHGAAGDMARWAARGEALALARGGPQGALYAGRAANQLGVVGLLRGDSGAARAAYQRAVAVLAGVAGSAADRAVAFNGLAECARAVGDLDGAEEALRAADATKPRDMYRLNLAIIQIERGLVAAAAVTLATVGPRLSPPIIAHCAALARAVCAAAEGDAEETDRALTPFSRGWPGGPVEPDVARLATAVATHVTDWPGWKDREVCARRVALAVWERLDRVGEADSEARALGELARGGAPAVLGPFRMERRIADGAFGEVWQARHDQGTAVAIKILARFVPPESLERELRAVAALDHPHVVRLLDHGRIDRAGAAMIPGVTEGQAWLATDLADGTLQPLLGMLSWARVVEVLLALLDALAHAHARGLIHLDVKPANVLLAGDVPKLADFGLSAVVGAVMGPIAGTPAYMAPEQFLKGKLGPWTDLYAVGCVAAALASGAPPFDAESVPALATAHCLSEPDVQPCVPVPQGFSSWLGRMLAKHQDDRFQRAADAASALRSLGPATVAPQVRLPLYAGAPLPTVRATATTLRVPPAPVDTVITGGDGWIAIPPPTVPRHWARRREPPPPLADAGLALFNLRAPPFVGRRRARSRLWAALRDVVGRGKGRVVAIEAERGFGATATAHWLCERAHEVGAADIHAVRTTAADRPGEGVARAVEAIASGRGRPAVLWLDRSANDRETNALLRDLLARALPVLVIAGFEVDLPGSVPLPLGPLPRGEQEELLSSLLPLAPATLATLADRTAGHPRHAVQLLTHLVHGDALEARPDGATLAEGIELPETIDALWRYRLRAALTELPRTGRAALRIAASLEPAVDDRMWEERCRAAGVPFQPGGRDALLDARLAVSWGPGRWAFEDPALQALLAEDPGRS